MKRAFLALMLAVLPAASALPAAPINADFEANSAGQAPAGWSLHQASASDGYRWETVDRGYAGRGGRLAARDGLANDPMHGATASERVDAARYRGRIVRLRARIKVLQSGAHVGLELRVRRPVPKFAGFNDMMNDRPIAAGDWAEHEIVGRVAVDAETIEFGLVVRGDADVEIDDVSLQTVQPDPRPPSAEARTYLLAAIDVLRAQHIDSATADWAAITADALAEIGGATKPVDTYGAIRGVLGALGEKHSFFVPPSERTTPAPAKTGGVPPAAFPLPTGALVDGRYGLIRLPGLNTIGPDGVARGATYRAVAVSALRLLDAQQVCGWIVDLRGNGGGNMWPMLSGIDPLLGPAPFGAFVTTTGARSMWERTPQGPLPAPVPPTPLAPTFALVHADAPLAVLVDGATASSGEMVAIALRGRANVRSFGPPTAGYTTANKPNELSDGAYLVVTGSFVRDRTGTDYRDAIQPDVVTTAGGTLVAATAWLAAHCSPKPH